MVAIGMGGGWMDGWMGRWMRKEDVRDPFWSMALDNHLTKLQGDSGSPVPPALPSPLNEGRAQRCKDLCLELFPSIHFLKECMRTPNKPHNFMC